MTTENTDTIIIGAGQAGLAVSYYLQQQDHEHLVLEKNRVGEAWRSGKWDSFTLVTPNWMLQLPGHAYQGDEPDGFLQRDEVIRYLDDYIFRVNPPLRLGVKVSAVKEAGKKYSLETSKGAYEASNVVVATGTFQMPNIPAFHAELSHDLHQLHSSAYRNPDELPPGAVLVVGSAQSGCQIADELNGHGRKVYLCTGEADRLPRRYRGKDSFWWAEQLGIFDQTPEDLPSPVARFKPNPQVSGKDGGKTLNLHQLAIDGVTLLGHVQDADGTKISLADDLKAHLAQADEFAAEFKKGVDQYIEKKGMELPEEEPAALQAGYEQQTKTRLDLKQKGIQSIIWATGYDFDYSWIKFPIFDDAGYPVQEQGVTSQPGLYFVGLHFLHNRKSGLLLGVGDDAAHIAEHIAD